MVGFDAYMTRERKAEFQDTLNMQLDAGAERYEEAREDGCRRRCGFFASTSNIMVALRDGFFLSTRFKPEDALPLAPDGWIVSNYALSEVEGIVDRQLRRTPVFVSTQNSLLKQFDDIATANGVGSVQIYRHENTVVAVAVRINKNGIRAAKNGEVNLASRVAVPFAVVDGIPLRRHEQEAYQGFGGTPEPVEYHHLSMNLDGQLSIVVLARADEAELGKLVSGFQLSTVIEELPHVPSNYVASAGVVIAEVEPHEDSN